MPAIVLSTFNAKYIHPSLGLRYLLVNLGPLEGDATLMEFDLAQRPVEAAESILAHEPKIVGVGVYIWNVELATELVFLLKSIKPELIVVVGGPEVSYEIESQAICQRADYVVVGEGELAFRDLCQALLQNKRPVPRIWQTKPLHLASLQLPYRYYSAKDIAERLVYVEASRGCPFGCEFCLSSLDRGVRNFPLGSFLSAMDELLERGAKRFKFIDRSFGLETDTACQILNFFLRRWRAGLCLHFEMFPDRLSVELAQLLKRFPPAAVQLEIGIQTFNEAVNRRIGRRQDKAKVKENLQRLRRECGVHIHADLVMGLPGEDIDSLAASFDELLALEPQEIQLGVLKRLRGTSISRHDKEWGMVYNPAPPYDILCNKQIDFPTMQRLKRMARYWDLVANSGNFLSSVPRILQGDNSPFRAFLRFSDWLFEHTAATHAIALPRLSRLVGRYLMQVLGYDQKSAQECLNKDCAYSGRKQLLNLDLNSQVSNSTVPRTAHINLRQQRHSRRCLSAAP